MTNKDHVQSFLKDIKKQHKKRKHPDGSRDGRDQTEKSSLSNPKVSKNEESAGSPTFNAPPLHFAAGSKPRPLLIPHKYILAPMVGGSELAFRLLCRKYGTELAYTPMMSAQQFANDEVYRQEEFQTIPADRPLVCHFSANNPADFVAASKLCQSNDLCDAIDLNLGCPQRVAYLGHYGSYLLDLKDRALICEIVRAAASAVDLPIFCKIRLLGKLEDTIELCQQLRTAGASLLAVHARYRASWERKGAGARDGAALLDQVEAIKKVVTDIPIIANGNVINYQDVVTNLALTKADGVMSAEGILDNPTLFLPQLGSPDEHRKHVEIPLLGASQQIGETALAIGDDDHGEKKIRKKLRKIAEIEDLMRRRSEDVLDDKQKKKVARKHHLIEKLQKLVGPAVETRDITLTKVPLASLYDAASDMFQIAQEYLDLATTFPVKMRTVIFHTRRILKESLVSYQLMEDCLCCQSISELRAIIEKMEGYKTNPKSFVFDIQKAQQEKEAIERKKREEGRRKEYEARMVRKAKREGKADLTFYLNIGAELPSLKSVARMKSLPREHVLVEWKEKHGQHCLAFHLDPEGCKRGRTCAFLHADLVNSKNHFAENEEVAG